MVRIALSRVPVIPAVRKDTGSNAALDKRGARLAGVRALVVVLTALVISLGLGLRADAASPGCGATVLASVKITKDITNCSANPALTIGDDDITLDLNGHTVDGTGVATGILASGKDHINIVNGTVTGFATGIQVANGHANLVKKITLTDNVSFGIMSSTADEAVIKGNHISGSATGISEDGSDDDIVKGNSITGGTTGIDVTNNATSISITGNTVKNATNGIVLRSASTSGSRTIGNKLIANSKGVFVNGASNNQVFDNVAKGGTDGIVVAAASFGTLLGGNATSGNSGFGIDVLETDGSVAIGDNHADDNGNWGIFAQPDNDDAGGNEAHGNGQFLQCHDVICRSK